MIALRSVRFVPGVRGSWRFIKRRIASKPLPSLTEWQIRKASSSIHDSKMEYKLKANLNTCCWLFGYSLFMSSSVTVGSVPAAHLINSSDCGVEMCKIGHQLRHPLRVLALVSFEQNGMANASCVRSVEVPRELPTNSVNASFCCFMTFAKVLGVHLLHLDHPMLPHFHGNRYCDRQSSQRAWNLLEPETFTRVRNERKKKRRRLLSCPSCPSESHNTCASLPWLGLSTFMANASS